MYGQLIMIINTFQCLSRQFIPYMFAKINRKRYNLNLFSHYSDVSLFTIII